MIQKNIAPEIIEKAGQIRLLVLDVDGVLTDGSLYFSDSGESMKVFSTLDGQGIKMLRNTGVEIAIISGRKSGPLIRRASDLGIVHMQLGREDKLNALNELLATLQFKLQEVAHLGDDLPDLPVMQSVGLGIAVNNAYELVKQRADWCTEKKGGAGAVREVCDFIMGAQGTLMDQLKPYLACSKNSDSYQ